jgi:F-type H+-transporting ATPase subunit alpha
MASIKADEITKILRTRSPTTTNRWRWTRWARSFRWATASRAVHGLEKAMAGEMLEFPHDVFGIALNLEEDQVGAVLLGEYTRLKRATPSSARARSCPRRWATRWWAAW